MPLIIFNVNTAYVTNARGLPEGISPDGSFKLSKRLDFIPSPDTIFKLRHVSFDGGGDASSAGGRNKKPSCWMSVHFPQMEEDFINSNTARKTIQGRFDNGGNPLPLTINDYGALRFPLITYPISGILSGANANNTERGTNSGSANKYQHRANHDMNLSLGRMKLEGGVLECEIRMRNIDGDLPTDRSGSTRFCRMRQMQVILEYN